MLINILINHIPKVKDNVDKRVKEFKDIQENDSDVWFGELCFCLLTANYSAEGSLKIQKAIGDKFDSMTLEELTKSLTELGHRYPNMRANFIYEARKYTHNIKDILINTPNKRDWLVKNIKGLGMKEASHFLRNIGFLDYAIIDRHILRMLSNHDNYPMPKTLTPKKYEEIESYLGNIAKQLNTTQGELDFYIWSLATGKILK
jgi:N-glycosylase/DNA lyase